MNNSVHTTWLGRNWKWLVPVICILGLTVLLGFVGLVFYGVTTMMKSSDAYQIALSKAKNDPEVISALGEPIVEGMLTTGNINESGSSGTADMAIPISGPKGEATIYLNARKSVGKWTFQDLIVEIKEKQDRIDLLHEKETLDQ